jgi:hypothetical protein
MTYLITGFTVSGPKSVPRDTATEALSTGAELQAEGYERVLIKTPSGTEFTVPEFYRAFSTGKPL